LHAAAAPIDHHRTNADKEQARKTNPREREGRWKSKGTTSAVKKLTTELVNKLSSYVQIACISSKLVKYQKYKLGNKSTNW
jgi:hypothetical protein